MTTADMTNTTRTSSLFEQVADWLPGIDTLPVLAAGMGLVICLARLF